MANELSINFSQFKFEKNGSSVNRSFGNLLRDVAGKVHVHTFQTIGTAAEEVLGKGEITTVGYVAVRNADATNFVEVGTTGKLAAKLKAGDIAVFRANGDVYAKANVANVDVEFILIED